ncbi:nicotinate phosphoribosyltransferase isoform X2 [Brachyistius frenatus]|uniref:nicotinate phosphoribosyltransferase isoform X2 n=1 Tax=Brachyistius frenatus TaxID=100188 RepID=UPI0037E81DCE
MAAPSSDTRAGRAERSVRERVPPLLTDLYQFTMAYAYWRAGRHQEPAVFELFFRDNPFGGGFSLFAGLLDCLLFLRSFHFTDGDVEFLRSVLPPTTDPAFFQFLRDLDCSGVTLCSVPEGTVVFARVPLMEVAGPLAVVQLLETSLLCLVNYASLVCSNAARFRLAAGPRRKLLEMGLRRAQGPDGGLTASRYSHIGGFDLTSNVQAGFLFGIPVAGTMAHSYVTSFTSLEEVWPQTLVAVNGDPDPVDVLSLTKGWLSRVCELLGAEPGKIREGELAAFLSYAIAYPQNFLPVIDSYSVSCFSIPSFESLLIVGTNNISEQSVAELNKKENEINVVGVGTHLVTCTRQPSLGCVYKLVEVRGRPRMKISEDPEKSTVPGRKAVYRLLDAEGHPFLDLLCLAADSPPEAGVLLSCFPLGCGDAATSVTPAQVTCLRQEVFSKGQVTQPLCSAAETRAKVQSSLQTLHPRHKRLQEPDSYTVALSEKLRNLVTEIQRGSSGDSNFLFAN